MATSGQYNFVPSEAELALEAFGRATIRAPAVDRDMMIEFRRSLNLLMIEYSNRPGVNLWAVDLQTIDLVAGQAVYDVDPATISVLDCYYSLLNGGGTGINTDRWMPSMSRTDYAMIPNKLQGGTPTRFWYEKLREGLQQFYVWEVPLTGQDTASGFAQVQFYRLRFIQDATMVSGEQLEVTKRALNAVTWDMAIMMAAKYKPELLAQPGNFLERMAKQSWQLFADSDREDADITITPMVGGYYRI